MKLKLAAVLATLASATFFTSAHAGDNPETSICFKNTTDDKMVVMMFETYKHRKPKQNRKFPVEANKTACIKYEDADKIYAHFMTPLDEGTKQRITRTSVVCPRIKGGFAYYWDLGVQGEKKTCKRNGASKEQIRTMTANARPY